MSAVTMKLEGEDCSPTVRSGLSSADVARAVRDLGHADATVTIFRDGIDEKLLVAVSRGMAVLGWERLDGLLQYVSNANDNREERTLRIGHQETNIESRYVLNLANAVDVIQEWLNNGETSSFGFWERQ
jgi:hypothetical protein